MTEATPLWTPGEDRIRDTSLWHLIQLAADLLISAEN